MRLFGLALLIIAVPAFGCPDLTGTYPTCRNQNGEAADSQNLVVTQKALAGGVQYDLTSTDANGESETESFLADGQVRQQTGQDPQTGATLTLLSQVSCQDNVVDVRMDLYSGSQMTTSLHIRAGKINNQFVIQTQGVNQGTQVQETVVCQ